MKKFKNLILITLIFLIPAFIIADAKEKKSVKRINIKQQSENREIAVKAPPFSPGIFPCSDCHEDMEINYKRRKLVDEHSGIILKHDEKNRWCLDCHSAKKRNYLHLASGKLVSFEESYILCGQCHGPKLRDWKKGIHGKRTGKWNGEKKYLLCVHCHNPHAPKFRKLKPLPPPVRQEDIR